MQQTPRSVPQLDTASSGQLPRRSGTSRPARFVARWTGLALALGAVACGSAAERPDTQEVSGSTDYMVSEATAARSGSAPCQHGTVVECKVWITDVDCFTGLAVCDHGELSGCMDADAAEATLEALEQAVE